MQGICTLFSRACPACVALRQRVVPEEHHLLLPLHRFNSGVVLGVQHRCELLSVVHPKGVTLANGRPTEENTGPC